MALLNNFKLIIIHFSNNFCLFLVKIDLIPNKLILSYTDLLKN